MSLPIVWRQSAREDLAGIVAFIAERSPTAARAMKSAIESAVLPASDYPYLFRERHNNALAAQINSRDLLAVVT